MNTYKVYICIQYLNIIYIYIYIYLYTNIRKRMDKKSNT